MLARRAGAEVVTRQQNRRALVAGLIQKEVRVRRAVFPFAPVEKQALAQAGPLDRFEKLLGDDLVGIHIDPIERSDEPGHFSKRLHLSHLLI